MLLVVVLSAALHAQTAPATAPAARQPKYPPKDARTLRTDAEIAQARANVAKYPSARAVADGIVKTADEWAAWSDDDLVALITDSRVPRAFDVGTAGCPKCGQQISEKFGSYPWLVDPKLPFKVTCPVDASVYPSNDYGAYYRSGFSEKAGWDTPHADDGWGWTDPTTGETFWFVAYWNHWTWHKHLVPGVLSLARAYQLTGDARYAHKAVVALHRIAEVYPAMDHPAQSRYGQLQAARGVRYRGKVVNAIWETGLAASLAEAYDAVWETIDADADAQARFGKGGAEMRANVEANLLEEIIAGVFSGEIRGNFGMHQNTLVTAGLTRQHGEQDKWFDALLNDPGTNAATTGLGFALYNLISRDGVPFETAPGYNFIWVNKLAAYGTTLQPTGRDVFKLPKTRRLFDGVLDVINARQFTPALGDSGSVWGGLTGKDAATFQAAYRNYNHPRYARFLASFGAAGDAGFTSYDALFRPPVEAASGQLDPRAPRLLDGYGMAILNDPADATSLSLYYGLKAGHGHFDRLGFELFASAQPMMPDLGYPDAMNDYVSGIYTWSKNTIAHNTVVVDASRQPNNVPGTVKLFADGGFARVVDVDATGTYPQCSQYRRAIIMVDVGEGRSYFVDVFTVAGGHQHDYSLHGPPGEFEMIGGEWSEPAKGTLAGEDVAAGALYDAPEMAAPGYKGGFGSYKGSGFQHFTGVRRHRSGEDWVAQWTHAKDQSAKLRIRVLTQPGQQVMSADARVSPVKYPEKLKYLIARRQGTDLSSRFVSVIEPFRDAPFIERVERVDDDTVRVRRVGGETDVVSFDDGFSVATVEGPRRAFIAGGEQPALTGDVIAVDPQKSTIRVRVSGDSHAAELAGRVVHFENAHRRTAHPVSAARDSGDGDLLLTTTDDLLVGRARLSGVEPEALLTNTALPLAPTYRGVAVCDDAFATFARVERVAGGKIVLAEPLPTNHPFAAGRDVWLVNVGPGDRLIVPNVRSTADAKPKSEQP